MAAERNDFNSLLGDMIYSDSEVGGLPPALTVPAKWAKYRESLSFPHLRNLRRSTGLYNHWDDHEFVNDFTRAEHGGAIYSAGVTAFRDYAPATFTSRDGLYRSFRWGKSLELFFLDERSFRSAKVRTVCGSDLAPTAPQTVRNAFASLVPGLANPVAPGCLEAINDPSRTMLGARQLCPGEGHRRRDHGDAERPEREARPRGDRRTLRAFHLRGSLGAPSAVRAAP